MLHSFSTAKVFGFPLGHGLSDLSFWTFKEIYPFLPRDLKMFIIQFFYISCICMTLISDFKTSSGGPKFRVCCLGRGHNITHLKQVIYYCVCNSNSKNNIISNITDLFIMTLWECLGLKEGSLGSVIAEKVSSFQRLN